MKFIKRLFRLIVLLAIVVLGFYMYQFLQREEVIVLNNSRLVMVRLQAVSKLVTAEEEMAGTENGEQPGWSILDSTTIDDQIYDFLFEDKMTINYKGRVMAGIDLEKISTGDIVTNLDGSVSIKLPEAEILYVKIDENDTPNRQLGILAGGGNADMETQIRESIENRMKEQAIKDGILEAATKNAHDALAGLLGEMNIRLSDGTIFDNDKDDEDSNDDSYEI